MADETTVSTPSETSVENTSVSEPVNDTDTSNTELNTESNEAETETQNNGTQQEKLYAGKYKSVEELEKGYQESQKFVQKASELEKRIQAFEQQKQQAEEQKQIEALKKAQERGFNTVEAQQIADKVQVAELEVYANNLNLVAPENYEVCRQALANYLQTENKAYLEQAKQFFGANFIEKVALYKKNVENQLQGEYNAKNAQLLDKKEQELADNIKAQYGEFLAGIKENPAVSQALQIFCNTGHIQSMEDMQTFVDLIGQMQNIYKEQAIKEYEAQKAIEATKNKAVIESTAMDYDNNKSYTGADVSKMSQREFDDYCKKHGTDWIYS